VAGVRAPAPAAPAPRPPRRRVDEVAPRHVGAERARHLARHPAYHLLDRAGLREYLADGEQRARLLQTLLGLRVQASVLQREGELAGDGHREVALPVLKARH